MTNPPSFPDKLLPNEELVVSPTPAQQQLRQTDRLTSQNATFRLMLQPDGNLVLSTMSMSTAGPHFQPIWGSKPYAGAVRCIMQPDGNLVIYNAASTALWWSGTQGNPGASLIVQNDGNLVIYAANGSTPLKWTGTAAGEGQSGNIFRSMQP